MQALRDCEVALSPFRDGNSKAPSSEAQKTVKEFHEEFVCSMSDDLHTATVLDKLEKLVNAINCSLAKFKVCYIVHCHTPRPSPPQSLNLHFKHTNHLHRKKIHLCFSYLERFSPIQSLTFLSFRKFHLCPIAGQTAGTGSSRSYCI